MAARPLGISTALTFHALGIEKRRQQSAKDTSPRERVGLERWLTGAVDRVLATSHSEVFELVRMGAARDRLRVVPCGVDVDAFRAEGPQWERAPGRPPRVGVVSRLVERKGIGNVVQAIAAVPGAELVIAGGPPGDRFAGDPEAARLRALAAALGIADRVRLLGPVERSEVPALLRSCDVVVCAPWYEPFGLVPLEAMACGVPVVGTAVGGIVDTVIHGGTGLLVPPRDPGALALAIGELLADPVRRAAMGRAGAARAQGFSWGRVAEATLAAYPPARGRAGVDTRAAPSSLAAR
jgi:glycosyltransferase involved in cell wall biosynthesis